MGWVARRQPGARLNPAVAAWRQNAAAAVRRQRGRAGARAPRREGPEPRPRWDEHGRPPIRFLAPEPAATGARDNATLCAYQPLDAVVRDSFRVRHSMLWDGLDFAH